MSRDINQNVDPLFIFEMPDDEVLANTISVKGEKGETGDPTKLSQLENDTGFITNAVTNLANYYAKSETYTQAQISALLANARNIDGKNLNTLVGERIVGYGNNCTNKPTSANGYLINIPHSYDNQKNNYNKQFWFIRDTNVIYMRSQVAGTFGDWVRINPDMTLYYTKTESDTLRNTNDYYDEITYKTERHYDTDCYFTTIPLNDNSNNQIDVHIKSNNNMTPTQYARANYTTLTTNATLTKKQSNNTYKDTIVIGDGVVLHEYDGEPITDEFYYYVGIKEDRSVTDYQVINTTSADMINDGVKQAFMAFFRIVKDGDEVTQTIDTAINKHPRQCLGVKADKTLIFLTCDGRTDADAGLTASECATLLINKGCVNAWNLDGGGSSSTTIKGSKLNENIDDDGTADRKLNYSLNVFKPTVNEAIAKAFSKIGEEKQNLIRQIVPYINAVVAGNIPTATTDIGGKDLDTLTDKVYFAYGNNLINKPTSENGYFINIPHGEKRFINLYAVQLYMERESTRIFTRQLINGTFSPWVLITGGATTLLYLQDEQTVSTTNSYQSLALRMDGQTYGNYVIPTDYLEGSSTKFYGFKLNRKGYFSVKISMQISTSTAANKYVRFERNGVEVNVSRIKPAAGTESIITLDFMTNNTNLDDVYGIKIYAASGDKVNRLRILVESR